MFRPEVAIFRDLNDFAAHAFWSASASVFMAEYLIFLMGGVILAYAGAVIWRERHVGLLEKLKRLIRRRESPATVSEKAALVVVRAALAGAVAYVANALIGLAWVRPRPFISLLNVHMLAGEPLSTKSFPSDHAAIAFAFAFAVVRTWPRFGGGLLVAAFLVAFGRVLVGVHYPSDVIAGALVGLLGAWVAARWEKMTTAPQSGKTGWNN